MEELKSYCYKRNWERREHYIKLPDGISANEVREHPECFRKLQIPATTVAVRGMLPLDTVLLEEDSGHVYECTVANTTLDGDVYLGTIRHLCQLSKPYEKSDAEARKAIFRKVAG